MTAPRLAVGLLVLAACQPEAPPPPPKPEAQKLFVHASMANLRRAPREDAPIVDKLPVGTPVLLVQTQGTWARLFAAQATGWAPSNLVGVEAPSLEWAERNLASTPLEDVAARRAWAERATVLAPNDPQPLERLIAILEKTPDKAALKHAQETLRQVKAALTRLARSGIIAVDATTARGAANVDSDLVATLNTGDVVDVIGEPEQSFLPVLTGGKKAWVPHVSVFMPEGQMVAAFGEATSEPGALDELPPLLLGPKIYDKLTKHAPAESRGAALRRVTTLVLSYFQSRAEYEPACRAVSLAWTAGLRDAEATTRVEVTRLVAETLASAGGGGVYRHEEGKQAILRALKDPALQKDAELKPWLTSVAAVVRSGGYGWSPEELAKLPPAPPSTAPSAPAPPPTSP